jgi:hypothetical protein
LENVIGFWPNLDASRVFRVRVGAEVGTYCRRLCIYLSL